MSLLKWKEGKWIDFPTRPRGGGRERMIAGFGWWKNFSSITIKRKNKAVNIF
jgi:hypothetical protein